jgi:hypothetical protein
MTSPSRRRPLVISAVTVTLLLSGCGGLSDDDVRRVAADFAAGDPGERCDLLAPSTYAAVAEESSCEDALEEISPGSGEVTEVAVWGEEAQAKLSDDTLFLTRTSSGWRVMAAACRPQGQDEPYDCQVEGT